MIVLLRPGCPPEQVEEVVNRLQELGMESRPLQADGQALLHVLAHDTRPARALIALEAVEALLPTSGPRVRREGRRFYPYHFTRWSAFGMVLLGLLVLLAGQLPPGRGAEPTLETLPAEAEPPWYMRPFETLVAQLPDSLAWLGWVLVWLLLLTAFALPIIDRSAGRPLRARWPVVAAGLAVLALLVLLALGGPLG